MKITKLSLITGTIFTLLFQTGTTLAEKKVVSRGETLTKTSCMVCHGDPINGGSRLAPPMAMVKRHYKDLTKAEQVAAIAAWAKAPNVKKSRMPGAVRRFKLMPPLPLPDKDLKAIAEYIVKTSFKLPTNCGKGCGKGRGKGKAGKSGKGSKGKCCEAPACGKSESKKNK